MKAIPAIGKALHTDLAGLRKNLEERRYPLYPLQLRSFAVSLVTRDQIVKDDCSID